jgi:AcrR family transcriptional regulator
MMLDTFARQTVVVKAWRSSSVMVYPSRVPKLWTETVDAHRSAVREAILERTGALVAAQGLPAVTMSRIAEEAGIGRATLYKYFPDVEAVLVAWHGEHVGHHLRHLAEVRDGDGTAVERLAVVLGECADIAGRRLLPGAQLATLLHRGDDVRRAEEHLVELVRDLVSEAVRDGDLRGDVAPDELARYCLAAVSAAGSLDAQAAVERLVGVVLDGLRVTSAPRR